MKKFLLFLLLGFPLRAFADIEVVGSVSAVNNNVTVTTGALNTTGATLLVAAVAYYPMDGTPLVTDSKSNSWTALTARCAASTCIRISYVCGATTGTGHTFTAADGVNQTFPAISVIAFTGAAITSCVDGEAAGGTTAGATSLQPGSLTPSQNLGVVVSAIGYLDAHMTATINGSFTIDQQIESDGANYLGIAQARLIQTTAAAANPTFSWTTSGEAAATSAAFKVAPIAVRRSNSTLLGVQ